MAYSSRPTLAAGDTFKNKDFNLSEQYTELIRLWNRLYRDPHFDLAMEVMRENPEAVRLWELLTIANNIHVNKSDDLNLIKKEIKQAKKVIESLTINDDGESNGKAEYVSNINRKLHVFLCHASQDKPVVRELYQRLLAEGWIDPWLDKEKLLPGQDWRTEIELAVESSDLVILCLSNNSVNKEGFVQKELRYAREVALEKPDNTIFLIPLRLSECEVPRGLRFFQRVDYFGETKDRAYSDLKRSLEVRREQVFLNNVEKIIDKPDNSGMSVTNEHSDQKVESSLGQDLIGLGKSNQTLGIVGISDQPQNLPKRIVATKRAF